MLEFLRIIKNLNQANVKKVITCVRLISLTRHHLDSKLLVSQGSTESHTFNTTCRKLTQIVEDVAWLILLTLFGESSVIGIVLEGDDQTKLKYLTNVMAILKSLRKSKYAAWLWFSNEGSGNRSSGSIPVILTYMVCLADRSKRWLASVHFPTGYTNREGVRFALAPSYLDSIYAWLDEYVGNVVQSMGSIKW